MTLARRAALLLVGLLLLCFAFGAQAQDASPSPTAPPSPTPTPAPTAVPLPDIVSASDSASEGLNDIQSELSSNKTVDNITRELAATTKEIDARELETRRILRPGVPLETLGDFETRWQKLADQLTAWSRQLTDRATALDRELTQMSATRTTWKATLELAGKSNAPPEVMQRINQLLQGIDATEEMLQNRRAAVLSLQTRVAEQTQRVNRGLRSIKSAQGAAVNRLWVQDSPPIWSPEVRTAAAQSLGRDSQVSLGAQAALVRNYLEREWTKLIYVALLFIAFAFIMLRVKRHVARWTDKDRTLDRTNRVLQLPFSTASLLTIISARLILHDAPRAVWLILATLALIPIVVLLRRLIDRHLFPIVNALVVFYFVAQLRVLAASIPVLSRIILLLETVGGLIFLIWFIRARRRSGPLTTSNKTARVAGSIAVAGFGAIIVADLLGYVALANYLSVAILTSAYFAVALYAAARILEGLVFFGLQIRPLASLAVVQRQRPLLRRRIERLIEGGSDRHLGSAGAECVLVTRSGHQPHDCLTQCQGRGGFGPFLLRRGRSLHSHHLDHAGSLAFAAFFPPRRNLRSLSPRARPGLRSLDPRALRRAAGRILYRNRRTRRRHDEVRYPGRCIRCRHRLRSAKRLQ